MLEFISHMLLPNFLALGLIFVLWIRQFNLWEKAWKIVPFLLLATIVSYAVGEGGVFVLRPWTFDCAKTIGCVSGLPFENVLVSLLLWLNVGMATISFMEIEKRSKNNREFLEYFFLLKKPSNQ